MEADFVLAYLPACDMEIKGRKETMETLISSLTVEDAVDVYETDEEIKTDMRQCIGEYCDFDRNREVGSINLHPLMAHYVSGGMAHGDSPTNAHEVMCKVLEVERVRWLLEKWAMEDKKNDSN